MKIYVNNKRIVAFATL